MGRAMCEQTAAKLAADLVEQVKIKQKPLKRRDFVILLNEQDKRLQVALKYAVDNAMLVREYHGSQTSYRLP